MVHIGHYTFDVLYDVIGQLRGTIGYGNNLSARTWMNHLRMVITQEACLF